MIRHILFSLLLLAAVQLQAEKVRLASLSPALTEILFQIGAEKQICGRSAACDYPRNAKSIPVVGNMGHPLIEPILASGAKVIVTDTLHPAVDPEIFERCKISLRQFSCRSLKEYPKTVSALGKLTGNERSAACESARFQQVISKLKSQKKPRPQRILVLISLDPLITCGNNTFIGEALALAGGENIAGGFSSQPYFYISREYVLKKNPECILLLSENPADAEKIKTSPVWAATDAVRRTGKVHIIHPDLLSRAGPRLTQGIEQVFRILEK